MIITSFFGRAVQGEMLPSRSKGQVRPSTLHIDRQSHAALKSCAMCFISAACRFAVRPILGESTGKRAVEYEANTRRVEWWK